MPIQKMKKPAKKPGTKPATPKAIASGNGKGFNGKNGKPSKAAPQPALPTPKPPPAPDRSDAKAQYKAFESGIQLLNRKHFREARDMFGKAAEGPNREIATNARSHIRMCERRLAAPAPSPKSADEHYNYGVALINMRNLAEARRHLGIALEMEPRADHVHYALGVCLALSGDSSGAYDSLKRAIDLHPRNRMVAIQDSDLDAISSHPRINRLLYPERNS